MLDITVIDNYFQNHPLSAEFFTFPAAERAGAAKVAEADVSAALDHLPVSPAQTGIFEAAVAEQCLCLLLNPEMLTGGETDDRRVRRGPLGLRAAALIAPLRDRGAALKLKRG